MVSELGCSIEAEYFHRTLKQRDFATFRFPFKNVVSAFFGSNFNQLIFKINILPSQMQDFIAPQTTTICDGKKPTPLKVFCLIHQSQIFFDFNIPYFVLGCFAFFDLRKWILTFYQISSWFYCQVEKCFARYGCPCSP